MNDDAKRIQLYDGIVWFFAALFLVSATITVITFGADILDESVTIKIDHTECGDQAMIDFVEITDMDRIVVSCKSIPGAVDE